MSRRDDNPAEEYADGERRRLDRSLVDDGALMNGGDGRPSHATGKEQDAPDECYPANGRRSH